MFEDGQVVEDDISGMFWHDYVVNIASLCCLQGIGELMLVFCGLFFDVLASKDDFNCSFSAHDSDLGGWPGIVEITVQMLRGHDIVSATICLSGDESDFGNGGFSICVEKFRSVLDDAAVLLISSRQEAWHVDEGNQRDVKRVAESNESSCLHGGVDVQATSEYRGLVCDDTNDFATDFTKSSDDVLSKFRHDLEELVPIQDRFDDDAHLIWLVRIVWNDIVQHITARLIPLVLSGPYSIWAFLP